MCTLENDLAQTDPGAILLAWQHEAKHGLPAGRQTVQLEIMTTHTAGPKTITRTVRHTLIKAWPSKLRLATARFGKSSVAMVTVTFTGGKLTGPNS